MEDEDYKKKYEKAIKRAEAVIKVAQNQKEVYGCITTIFPEFKEGEDERIRKWLIKAMKYLSEESTFFAEVSKDKVIAWLEKQDPKKHEEELENAYKCAEEVQYRKGYEDAKREFLKRGEQKPVEWSEEDEKMFNSAI